MPRTASARPSRRLARKLISASGMRAPSGVNRQCAAVSTRSGAISVAVQNEMPVSRRPIASQSRTASAGGQRAQRGRVGLHHTRVAIRLAGDRMQHRHRGGKRSEQRSARSARYVASRQGSGAACRPKRAKLWPAPTKNRTISAGSAPGPRVCPERPALAAAGRRWPSRSSSTVWTIGTSVPDPICIMQPILPAAIDVGLRHFQRFDLARLQLLGNLGLPSGL